MRKYYNHLVKKAIDVKNLITVEYINVSAGFSYNDEKHAFFEFIYVDNGAIKCETNNGDFPLAQGDFFFICPNTVHHYESSDGQSARILVVCFNAVGKLLNLLEGQNKLNAEEKNLLSLMLGEAKNAFIFPFKDKLVNVDMPIYGSEQLTENHLENLLISLVRNKLDIHKEVVFVPQNADIGSRLTKDIITILKKNIYDRITLEDIQHSLFYSKTFLNNTFKKNTGTSIMHYYRTLKIEEAKTLLKQGEAVNSVAYKLSFDCPNYFSKVFRGVTGLTPSQFKNTL